ncbi:MAG: histone deacetylase [Phycisphaerae bacterium]
MSFGTVAREAKAAMADEVSNHLDRRGFLRRACAATAVAGSAPVLVAEEKPAPQPARARGEEARLTGIVYDELYKKHLTGQWHPEKPARCDAIMAALSAKPLAEMLKRIRPRPAEEAELLACHTKQYVQTVRDDVKAGRLSLSTGDTTLCKDSMTAAMLAAGGVMAAVDAVVAGEVKNAFCVVRPPGHHAGPGKGMGFCIFNNIAVAARYAQKKHRLAKVLIADWDVHHGNGTQDIFYEDPSVLFFSTHQSPWYPGTGRAEETGAGKGKGTTLNCPFPAGSGRKQVLGAFTEKLAPAADKFEPDIVMISAGFDSRAGDPLGRFTLTDDDFADLTKLCLAIARRHAAGRVVSVVEGGYDLNGLAAASAAHVKALTGA